MLCYVYYRKDLVSKVHNFVHFNMCLALSCGLIVFLAGISTATGSPVSISDVDGFHVSE